eukprot:8872682-Lingulodinium_polyedra.AAC.1
MPSPTRWSRSSAPVWAKARTGRAQNAVVWGIGPPGRRAADAAFPSRLGPAAAPRQLEPRRWLA